MKTTSQTRRTSARWVGALIVLLALPAAAQERVAQLSQVTGEVTVTRAADGRVEAARQVGPRVRGGSIFPADEIAAGAGASATLVYTDGSRFQLAANSRVVVEKEVDLAAELRAGKAEAPIGRRIRLLAGEIYSEIAPNPQVVTKIETPSGVAAVRGTRFRISVDRDGEQRGAAAAR